MVHVAILRVFRVGLFLEGWIPGKDPGEVGRCCLGFFLMLAVSPFLETASP